MQENNELQTIERELEKSYPGVIWDESLKEYQRVRSEKKRFIKNGLTALGIGAIAVLDSTLTKTANRRYAAMQENNELQTTKPELEKNYPEVIGDESLKEYQQVKNKNRLMVLGSRVIALLAKMSFFSVLCIVLLGMQIAFLSLLMFGPLVFFLLFYIFAVIFIIAANRGSPV